MSEITFESITAWNKSVVYAEDADPELIEQLWSAPDSFVDSGKRLDQKDCVRTTVRYEAKAERYVVKRHRERSWRHFAKQCFSRSRAEKCWADTWFLVKYGYPTPRPVAYRENRLGPLRGNSYYVYEYQEGRTLKELATGSKNQRLLRKYVTQLAEIWRLHSQIGINLSDGHPANIIVDALGKMWMIDLDKLKFLPDNEKRSAKLQATFESTMCGVIGDQRIVNFGMKKYREIVEDVAVLQAVQSAA